MEASHPVEWNSEYNKIPLVASEDMELVRYQENTTGNQLCYQNRDLSPITIEHSFILSRLSIFMRDRLYCPEYISFLLSWLVNF